MRVKARTWRGDVTMDLVDALTPDRCDEGGQVERAAADAETLRNVLGRLLAELVERNVISLGDADAISGNWNNPERVPE